MSVSLCSCHDTFADDGFETEEPVELMEDAPHDYIWGVGADGSGKNTLGVMLMKLRDELMAKEQ